MNEYKKVQIIKHALDKYTQREGVTEKELQQERKLLQKYSDEAEMLKEKYRIK